MKTFNSILTLRRDNDYNYAKVADKFIPANGEVCLVDTARSGLRAVCGDGVTPYAQLEYIDSVFVRGYLKDDGIFYKDIDATQPYEKNTNVLYIDIPTNSISYYDGEKYQELSSIKLPTASATTPGIMKLYSTTGQNIDGTMTQKAITDELNEKVEITLNTAEELIIFSYD